MKALPICCVLLWAASAVKAQPATEDEIRAKREAERMHSTLLAVGGSGPVVRNKPYSAEAVTEVLPVGASVPARRNVTRNFRDSAGRTRRDQTIAALAPATSPLAASFTVISDPVGGHDFILDSSRKTVRRFPRFESGVPTDVVRSGVNTPLGKRLISGLECTGMRRVVKVAAIEVVTETWRSEAIEALVQSTTVDPRFGTVICTLRSIVLQEPSRTLFEPPADYKLEFEGRPGVMRNLAVRP